MSFLESYVEYATEFTDSPASFHHRIGLSILSSVTNGQVYLWQGYKRVLPNIWLIVVAPSSFYRKSYSLGIAENLLRETGQRTGQSYILPREFSPEKFVEILAERPQGLLVIYEFKTFMAMMGREYMAGTQAMITELFDNPEIYNRETKTGTHEIRNPFLNVLSATTMDWFRNSIKDDDQAGGFLPRFLIVTHMGKKEKTLAWQPLADMAKKDILIGKLIAVSKLVGPCKVSGEAKSCYESWYCEFEKKWSRPGRLSPFLARIQEYAKKLAILLCIDETLGLDIGEKHMAAACRMAETYAREIAVMMDEELTYTSKSQRKVIEVLKAAGQDGITREELIRKTRLLADRQLNPILATFSESKQVKTKTVKSLNSQGAERVKTVYFWTNGRYEDE